MVLDRTRRAEAVCRRVKHCRLELALLVLSFNGNGKQESFWNPVEGRLLPMLEGENDLTLALLNQATQAWVELDYHHQVHSETGQGSDGSSRSTETAMPMGCEA